MVTSTESRVRHATRRANELRAAIAEWNVHERLSTAIEVASDRRTIELVVRFDSEPPSDSWGLLLGEVLHHLRSGLDNAVYSCAARRSGGRPATPQHLQFPIADDVGDFHRSARRKLGEAYDDLVDLVLAFQPFGVGAGEQFLQPGDQLLGQHPLSVLRTLNNADKHREWAVLPVAVSEVQFGSEEVPFAIEFEDLSDFDDDDLPIEAFDIGGDDLRDGAAILTVRCKAEVKSVTAIGSIRPVVGVPTAAGPVELESLILGLTFVCGLIMLRLDDLEAETDVIYRRLGELLESSPSV